MLNVMMKASFTIIGAVTGFTLTKTLFSVENTGLSDNLKVAAFVVATLAIALLFYTTGNKLIEGLAGVLDKLELLLQKLTLYELTVSSGGLIVGLIIANLVTIPINKVDIIGVPISIFANILFGCLGIGIAAGKRSEAFYDHSKEKEDSGNKLKTDDLPKILDTSVIIDGRIADICRAGFLDGELIIPGFVLEELRHIADSTDPLKRNRGRRGLDVLNIIQNELKHPVKIESMDFDDIAEVDDKLLKVASKMGGKVVTIDYNLNKVACFQGVPVLNINELANSVKPIALPGEEMIVQVIKDGKENGQGIGYLDDGTMIVVEGGRRHIGESICVLVTSVLQTAAGRMIFAKPKYAIERIIERVI